MKEHFPRIEEKQQVGESRLEERLKEHPLLKARVEALLGDC
jgi:hypothetical protein